MKKRTPREQKLAASAAALLGALLLLPAAALGNGEEPPALAEQVAAGTLPPMAERLPKAPYVDDLGSRGLEPGRYGGTLRLLMGGARDVRQMVVYGYARLVGYQKDLALTPDILERLEVEDNRVFTFHLRPGHRWSDGHPFTSEDFAIGGRTSPTTTSSFRSGRRWC